jgi:hypothetical protein
MADTAISLTKAAQSSQAVTNFRKAFTGDETFAVTPDRLEDCTIIVTNTKNATRTYTITAGNGSAAGAGNLTQALTDGTTNQLWVVSGLDSARFLHADGKLRIAIPSDTTGFVQVIQK